MDRSGLRETISTRGKYLSARSRILGRVRGKSIIVPRMARAPKSSDAFPAGCRLSVFLNPLGNDNRPRGRSESSSGILRFSAPEVGSGFHANAAIDGENRAGHIG